MTLKRWEDLPDIIRIAAVRPYYDILSSKKASLLLKRIFDVIVSFIMLVLLLPILLIISIVISVDSRGGVFFRQTRITQYGREFKIFKFRTMVANAEKLGTQVTTSEDSRVTRVGGVLRKFRIDELPQLINILKGDMTFVGTRPEVKRYVDEYNDEMMATLLLPAGVTSLASITYKDEARLLDAAHNPHRVYIEEILPQKMEYNLDELKKFSFLNDIKTMIKTVFAVIKG